MTRVWVLWVLAWLNGWAVPVYALDLGIHCSLSESDLATARRLGARYIMLQDFGAGLCRADMLYGTNRWSVRIWTNELQRVAQAGLIPVGVLHTRRSWHVVTNGPLVHVDLRWPGEPSIGAMAAMSPWQQYVHEAVAAHHRWVRFWQVTWEPTEWEVLGLSGHEGYNAHVETAAQLFVEQVRQAERVIRRYNGVVIAGGFPIRRGVFPWRCLQLGLAQYCDVLAIHYGYGGTDSATDAAAYIAQVRALRAAAGGKPIWNTEANILRSSDEGGEIVVPEADALRRLIEVNKAAGVEMLAYYFATHNPYGRAPGLAHNLCSGAVVRAWAWALTNRTVATVSPVRYRGVLEFWEATGDE